MCIHREGGGMQEELRGGQRSLDVPRGAQNRLEEPRAVWRAPEEPGVAVAVRTNFSKLR